MTSARVCTGFSLVLSFDFTAGIISPIFGAWLNNLIVDWSKIEILEIAQAYGLSWSLFIIEILSCAICFFTILRIDETGIRNLTKTPNK